MSRSRYIAVILVLALWPAMHHSATADMLPSSTLDYLDMQRFWQGRLPLAGGEQIVRVALLDDNLYALTDGNRAYAVHAHTGVLRWSRAVVDPELTVRGPSHADQFVFFTTPGGVRVLNRSTGEPAGEPRKLRGVVIEVTHDTAEINIGSLHGVRLGNILEIHYPGPSSDIVGPGFAQMRVTSIKPRRAKGRLAQVKAERRPQSGDVVAAEVVLPLPSVELPFAASSAAIADDEWIYVGAANQRFYCLNILSGFERWQLRTPRTVAATPVLYGDDLYFAGQDGLVVSCTKNNRVKNWTFQTEGPIFANPLVTDDLVYIASSDRSLYCLDRRTGQRRWRQRFDNPLDKAPILSEGRAYLSVPQTGLVVLDAARGKEQWRRPEGGEFLMQLGSNAYLWNGGNGYGNAITVVNVETGNSIKTAGAGVAEFAAAARTDQSILLVSRDGEMMCLRSAKAPHLKPAALVAVLENDRAEAQFKKGEPEKAAAAPPRERLVSARYRFLMEDWFSSRSTAKPVGGRGLVEVGAEAGAESEDVTLEDEGDEDEVMEDVGDEDEDEDWEEDDEDWEEDDEDEDEGDEDGAGSGSKGSSGGVKG